MDLLCIWIPAVVFGSSNLVSSGSTRIGVFFSPGIILNQGKEVGKKDDRWVQESSIVQVVRLVLGRLEVP